MTTTSTAVKSNCMTKLQKTIITAALAVSTSFVIYEVRQAAQLKQEYQMVKNNPSEYLQELQRERDDASNRVAWLTEELARETLNKDEFRNFGGYWFLMTLQRPEKLRFAA